MCPFPDDSGGGGGAGMSIKAQTQSPPCWVTSGSQEQSGDRTTASSELELPQGQLLRQWFESPTSAVGLVPSSHALTALD